MMYYPEKVLFHVEIFDGWNRKLFECYRPYKSANSAYAAARRIAKANYPNYKYMRIQQA